MKYASKDNVYSDDVVAPLAGAWIEMIEDVNANNLSCVAPLAGAWIEIRPSGTGSIPGTGRSPRGSVD